MPGLTNLSSLNTAAFFLFQDTDPRAHDMHWAMICLCVIAIALVIQAVSIVVGAFFAAALLHRVKGIADIVEKKTGPILDKTTVILEELTPKIKSITENAEQISYTVRSKVDELSVTVSQLNDTVQEINGRTRMQVTRVDGIVTDALLATEEISNTVQQGIKAPVRQIAGLIAGVKAGLGTLIERSPFGNR